MFKVGEYIHYGSIGLCRVEEITTLSMSAADRDRLYYKLSPMEEHGRIIFTPVDNDRVVMRRVMNKAEAESLIDELPMISLIDIPDEKKRELSYKEALSSPDCHDWVALIKELNRRRQIRIDEGKKVTATEDRYYQSALNRLHNEISVATGVDRGEVEVYIQNRLAGK